jgi:magnesium chelatase family protein
MTARQLRDLARATPGALRLLYELHDRQALSARGHARVLRVARTIADLDGAEHVGTDHIHAAAGLRLQEPASAVAA